jgi:hypothetical protein
MSVNVCTREEKDRIAELIGDFRFTKGFGGTAVPAGRHGIGVHHAGMLPSTAGWWSCSPRRAAQGRLRHGHARRRHQRADPHRAVHRADRSTTASVAAPQGPRVPTRSPVGAGRDRLRLVRTVVVQAPSTVEKREALAKAGDDPRAQAGERKKPPEGFVSWGSDVRALGPTRAADSSFRSATRCCSTSSPARRPYEAMRHLLTDNHEPRGGQLRHIRRRSRSTARCCAAGVVGRSARRRWAGPCGSPRPAAGLRAEPAAVAVRRRRSELLDRESPTLP